MANKSRPCITEFPLVPEIFRCRGRRWGWQWPKGGGEDGVFGGKGTWHMPSLAVVVCRTRGLNNVWAFSVDAGVSGANSVVPRVICPPSPFFTCGWHPKAHPIICQEGPVRGIVTPTYGQVAL